MYILTDVSNDLQNLAEPPFLSTWNRRKTRKGNVHLKVMIGFLPFADNNLIFRTKSRRHTHNSGEF